VAFECPVCGFKTTSAAHLAGHMANAITLFEEHQEWIVSRNVSFVDAVGFGAAKGNLRPLIQVVERECGTPD
jgi:hypothetical protein